MLDGRFERGAEDHGFAADGGLVEIQFLEIVHTNLPKGQMCFPFIWGFPTEISSRGEENFFLRMRRTFGLQ